MDLKHLTDRILLTDTKNLAAQERELTTAILHHLAEIDRRQLFSDLGFSSLFDYCVRELGYTESSAYRRIQSARLLKKLPVIEKKIESGSLNLMTLSLADNFFKKNEIKEPEKQKVILNKLENCSKKECEQELFKLSGKPETEIKDKKKRISENKIRYSITFTDETLDVIEEAKGLIHKQMEMDELIRYLATKAIQLLKKEKFKLNSSKSQLPPVNVNRVISAGVKRKVYLRDKACTKCGSTHRLQFDHRKPFALGGDSSAKNIRVLCFSCNQRARIRARL